MAAPRYDSFGLAGAGKAAGATEAIALLRDGSALPESLLAYGNGRSYGDSCLNDAGTLVDMRAVNAITGLDPETGILDAEAGAMLADIIAHAAPHGFFPAVVPGTRFVTLGGAIANDVHGKNHHARGSFGCHVERLSLLRSDGRIYDCSRTENSDLFAATIGGMGLTGLILSARIRLMPVASPDIEERVQVFDDLDGYFERAEAADRDNEYAVAWVDQLARGGQRGVLITGNHASNGRRDAVSANARLGVPFQPPFCVLGRPFLKVFNEAYFQAKARAKTPRTASWQSFFFPLDGVANWNRLYGPRGLYQHQSVIPEAAREAIPALFDAARRAAHGSFLTVLKRFGAMRSPGLMSFARPGYTLTLDFPNHGAATRDLLAELDRITISAGGAVNPYKDAHMDAGVFDASFPGWRAVEMLRDPVFVSDFWRRTALRLPAVAQAVPEAAE